MKLRLNKSKVFPDLAMAVSKKAGYKIESTKIAYQLIGSFEKK